MAIEDRILELYKTHKNIRAVSKESGLCEQTVRRMLISRGVYPSEASKKIARLRLSECSDEEIMRIMGISRKVLQSHSPYTKGTYKGSNKSANACYIAKCRARRKKEESTCAS